MLLTMAGVSAPATERPKKTSAPSMASASVRHLVATAWADFHWFMPWVRPLKTTPFESARMTLSLGTPSDLTSSTQAIAAAPAPLHTILQVLRSRLVRWRALIRPAVAMIAVPCWSSWKTGISISSRRRCSMMKQSGALMSSRLMPPKEGPRWRTAPMKSSTSLVSTSRSIESTSANRLKSTALPSITGFEASAPRSPRPRMAVPFEITATRFPLAV